MGLCTIDKNIGYCHMYTESKETTVLKETMNYWKHSPLKISGVKLYERFCNLCQTNAVEDVVHFLMYCEIFELIRRDMYNCIEESVMDATWHFFSRLSIEMKCFILLGLQVPICPFDLLKIRRISSFYINKMYKRRSFLISDNWVLTIFCV